MPNLTNKLILVDFDGTITHHSYPELGEPMERAFEVLVKLKEAGAWLVLWTCREDTAKRKYLTEAVEFCKANGVEFHSVNDAPIELDFRESGLRRKPHAWAIIDDRNLGGFPGWTEVESILLG